MAMSVIRKFSLLRIGLRSEFLHLRCASGLPDVLTRSYSKYPPSYVEPLYTQKSQEEAVEVGALEELKFKPVKAAYVFQNNSVFHDPLVVKFSQHIMKAGQRSLARELMVQTFEQIKRIQIKKKIEAESPEEGEMIEANPLKIFNQAVENCRPVLHLVPVKRGGITYKVPVPLTEKRSYFVAIRWLKEAGREKFRTVHFPEKMAKELIDAANNEGRVVKKKQDLHRQCEANRAYAHYRWS
ncbi:28S ribosomal protein S7, mitochondrial [Halocaridina rubra]|uniref:28S ribosomal protein S7, mitochondrial n=1 Tax=Halocaridina rubra TaxID=373956 RepID=A0AAN8WNH7_HALRR